MTRLFTSGFETGELSEFDLVSAGMTVGSSIKRSGTYSGYCASTRGASIAITSSSEIYLGAAFYPTNTYTGTGRNLFTFTGSAGAICSLRCHTTSTDLYEVFVLGTSVGEITRPSLEQWAYFQFCAKIDATVGEFTIKLDGTQVFTFSGNTGSNNIISIMFNSSATNGIQWHIDDIVVNDSLGSYNNSWTGQPKLIPAVVNGDGSVTALSRGGTDTGYNYSQVNSVPASDASYVYTGTSDEYDLYTVAETLASALPEGATIINLIVVTRGRVDGGAGSGCGVLLSGTTLEEGDPKVMSGTFATRNDAFPTDEGGIAWTLARANAVEIGPMAKDLE
jgi:hypothetical protein